MKLEDYSKYYIQGSDHYLIPKDIFIELLEEMINWKQENQQLKEEFDRMFAIYHSRKLIKKFNDEYDEEDKMKNPNRDYACVCPDAEEVYKRYYKLKEQLQQKDNENKELCKKIKTNEKSRRKMQKSLMEKLQQKEDIINKAKEFAKEHIFQFDGDKDFDALLEILDNKGENI